MVTSSIALFLTHGQTWTHGRTNTSFTRTWSWHYSLDSLLTYMKKSRKPSTGIRRCMILPEYSEPASLPLPRNGLCPNYHYLYVCGCQREKKTRAACCYAYLYYSLSLWLRHCSLSPPFQWGLSLEKLDILFTICV